MAYISIFTGIDVGYYDKLAVGVRSWVRVADFVQVVQVRKRKYI